MRKLLGFLIFVVGGLWGCEQVAKSDENLGGTGSIALPPDNENSGGKGSAPLPPECATGFSSKNYVLGAEEVYVTYEIYFDCPFHELVFYTDRLDYDHPYDDLITSGIDINLDYGCAERNKLQEDKPHSIHIFDYDFNGEVDYVATFGSYDYLEGRYFCQDYSDDYERGDEADAAVMVKAQELFYIFQADLEQQAIENFSSRHGKIDPFRFL